MYEHPLHVELSAMDSAIAVQRTVPGSRPSTSLAGRIHRIVEIASGRRAAARGDGAAPSPAGLADAAATAVVAASPRYRTLVGVDIAGFGRRDGQTQNYVRTAMYSALEESFLRAGVPWPDPPWWEDRGDGALITMSPDVPVQQVIDSLVPRLHAMLRRHNRMSSEIAQITLRMAIHAGFICPDGRGLTGDALVYLYRLLDAQTFKDAVLSSRAMLGLIVSRHIYDEVIRQGYGLIDSESFTRVTVVNKETTAQSWIHLPGRQGQ